MRRRWGMGTWVGGGVVLVLALAVLAPFLYMVASSLEGAGGVSAYAAVLTALPFGRFYLNAVIFVVLVVPRFLIIDALGWVDSYQGLIVTEIVSVWGIFLLRQFFLTLPRDLEDAARLDGAGEWTIFWRVVLPLSKPALATVAVFAFVDQWRNLLWPLVATRSVEMNVVEVGLARLHGLPGTTWPQQMAAAVTVLVPLLIVFVLAQKYFMKGVQLTSLK